MIFVDDKTQQERYAICEQCEHFTALLFCGKCNCFMPVKTKLPSKKCPINKWDRIIVEPLRKDK